MKKRKLYALLIASLLLVAAACSRSDDVNEIAKAVNRNNITKITASTQMTTPKQDVVLNENDWGKLLDTFGSYSLRQVEDERESNGWEFLFKIEEEDDVITLISFMENRAFVNGIMYEVKDYSKEDFLKIFE